MNYRKRHGIQHKVELATLLKIAIANNPGDKFNATGCTLIATLANEARQSLKRPEVLYKKWPHPKKLQLKMKAKKFNMNLFRFHIHSVYF